MEVKMLNQSIFLEVDYWVN